MSILIINYLNCNVNKNQPWQLKFQFQFTHKRLLVQSKLQHITKNSLSQAPDHCSLDILFLQRWKKKLQLLELKIVSFSFLFYHKTVKYSLSFIRNLFPFLQFCHSTQYFWQVWTTQLATKTNSFWERD